MDQFQDEPRIALTSLAPLAFPLLTHDARARWEERGKRQGDPGTFGDATGMVGPEEGAWRSDSLEQSR